MARGVEGCELEEGEGESGAEEEDEEEEGGGGAVWEDVLRGKGREGRGNKNDEREKKLMF